MKYEKRTKAVLGAVWIFLCCVLSGCSLSFCGLTVGGKEELEFTCEEGLPEDIRDTVRVDDSPSVFERVKDKIINVMLQLIKQKLPKFVDAAEYDIQVLTPMRKGLLGVERLNNILQMYLNPEDPKKREKEYGSIVFREGDKVMQVKNNYQLEWEIRTKYGLSIDKGMGVFNGDTGIIQEINYFAETMTISFDEGKIVEYPFKQLEELELAYAITIHKSQGSEYPAVVIPMFQGPRMLMNRNLLYTAVTRAKKCVTLVGDEGVFYTMVNNTSQLKRYSGLQDRLMETM